MEPRKEKIIGWTSPSISHPGEHLLDFLDDTGLSQADLAERIGMTPKAINEIVKGKAPITQNTAIKLSKIFSVSPELWVNLQSSYDLAIACQNEEKKLAVETTEYLPCFHETFKELCRIGAVEDIRWVKKNFLNITRLLQHFFAVDSLAYIQQSTMAFAFRKYDRKSINHYSLAAWVQLGKIKAQKTAVEPFNQERLKSLLPEIKTLSIQNWTRYVEELERLLASCGVVLVYAPHMTRAPVQGATHWIEPTKVLLMLHSDHQSEDKFWFNLFHEIGHILLHGKKDVYVDFCEDGRHGSVDANAGVYHQD